MQPSGKRPVGRPPKAVKQVPPPSRTRNGRLSVPTSRIQQASENIINYVHCSLTVDIDSLQEEMNRKITEDAMRSETSLLKDTARSKAVALNAKVMEKRRYIVEDSIGNCSSFHSLYLLGLMPCSR
jgi:hypothetical protein